MADLLTPLMMLRDQAFDELRASKEYAEFKALDDAVKRLGGASVVLAETSQTSQFGALASRVVQQTQQRAVENRRLSQADIAENALVLANEPLPLGRLMEAAVEQGAKIGGENPVNNFRSTVSKDNRFYPLKRNGMYFWWLAGRAIPSAWTNEAESNVLPGLDDPASSSNAN